ncbi:MAG: hypothetical protein Q3996_01680 [Candidatus Saccharibacteria bacterium]|nr:hypothetical protein [Candidatus Saccharibacteria bacterium]
MKQKINKSTKIQAKKSFWQQEISFDLSKSPVLNFLKQDIDMNINHSPVVNFLKQDIDMDLSHSPVMNFLNKKIVLDGFVNVSASPILNWFKPATTKSRKINVKSDEVVVKSLAKDVIISCLIVSLIINLFFFISWVYYQEAPAARQAIVQMIFG